jgi:multidrug efflux pump
MNGLIDAAFSRARVVSLLFAMILAIGTVAYVAIPKESSPEIPIPTVYVFASFDGISPGDAERLLVEPLETELAAIAGLKEMKADAGEGFSSITLEFEAGSDVELAIEKVREAVDNAESELPDDATTDVYEINTALFPILTAILSGPVPERTLNGIAEDLQSDLESLGGVLEVDIGGAREELLEVLIDPTVFQTYNLSFDELVSQISRNNRLIAAGALDTGAGRLVLKVPGLIEELSDVMEMPVKVRGDTVVTFADIATVRRTYRDPEGFARIDGQPALALEVKKRSGANIIDTVDEVRAAIAAAQLDWPDSLSIDTWATARRRPSTRPSRRSRRAPAR